MTRISIDQMPEVKSEEQKRHLIRYVNFINSRPERELKQKGFHTHHIYPKSIAKKNEIEDYDGDWNLIELTPREHLIAHMILWKCGYREMAFAYKYMTKINEKSDVKISSKEYEKICSTLSHSKETKEKMSLSSKGIPKSEKHKESLSKSKLNKPTKHWKGKNFSQEHKKQLSESKNRCIINNPAYSKQLKLNMLKASKVHQELFLKSYIVYYENNSTKLFEKVSKTFICRTLHISKSTFENLILGKKSRKTKQILKIDLLVDN